MIKKFIKISGTGKYLNYAHSTVPSPHRTTDFEKINLIYGENGSGKTTLSVILQSLRGDNDLLTRKRAFDRSIPQSIEILTDRVIGPKLSYVNSVWDNHYPDIEIFDIHFINQNIYTGLEIQSHHKKNLFEIIFGSQGIQLKQDIQNIKDRIQEGNRAYRQLSTDIESTIDKAYPASIFCTLPVDPDIEQKIRTKESEITTAKSYDEIQAKSTLASIKDLISPIEQENTVKLFSTSLSTISDAYLTKFKEHKEHLKIDNPERWIEQGYSAIVDNKCPFCLRVFDETTEILEAYNQYFNEEYKEHSSAIIELTGKLSDFNLEVLLLEIDSAIASNKLLIEFWKNHIPEGHLEFVTLEPQKEKISEALANIRLANGFKIINPMQSVPSGWVNQFFDGISELNSAIKDFNSNISEYNTKIQTLKTSTQRNIPSLELELKKLKAIQQKAEPGVSKLCTDYEVKGREIQQLNTDKDIKQQQLDTYTAGIFSNYSTRINYYLRIFTPYLEIRDLDSAYVGSSTVPMVKYALHINGNEIKQDDSPSDPSFRFSLSEGDKTALALAFFLAKLDVSGNIQDKIIVFDDPVSSFDFNRKSATISKLISFGQLSKQLFVLTHNIIFATEFWKAANQIPSTKQCSKIEFLGTTSCIVEYNIDVETLSGILKDSLKLKKYLTDGCVTDMDRRDVARCIRPALESYFHLKFFDIVGSNDWLGDFIQEVRDSSPSDPFNRLQPSLSELTEINDYSKRYHHRSNSNADSEPINDAELRSYCERTLNLIQLI